MSASTTAIHNGLVGALSELGNDGDGTLPTILQKGVLHAVRDLVVGGTVPSVRDHYAAAALIGLLSARGYADVGEVAREALVIADAVLVAKNGAPQ